MAYLTCLLAIVVSSYIVHIFITVNFHLNHTFIIPNKKPRQGEFGNLTIVTQTLCWLWNATLETFH